MNSRMEEQTRSDIARILEFKSTPRELDKQIPYEDLFRTDCGKRFGSQAQDLVAFVVKGQVLSIILPRTGSIASIVADGIARGDLDAISDTMSPQEQKQIAAAKELMKGVNVPRPDEIEDAVYSREDALWFLSLVTFALYSYLDAFSVCIIKKAAKSRTMRNRMNTHLENRSPPILDVARDQVRRVGQVRSLGVYRRLAALEEGLELTPVIEGCIGGSEIAEIRRACRKFNKIRHKIAHADPRLREDQYTFEEFERDLKEPLLEFEDVKKSAHLPKYIEDVMPLIRPGIDEVSDVVRKTALVVRMALTYPAIIDVSLHALDKEESG